MSYLYCIVDVAGIEPAFEAFGLGNLLFIRFILPFHALMRGTSCGQVVN